MVPSGKGAAASAHDRHARVAKMMARYLGEPLMAGFADDDVTEVYLNPQDGHVRYDTLDEQAFPFLLADAIQIKVRRQGAVRATTVLLAIGINETGYREILGLEVAFGETGEAWQGFFRSLRRRGLGGVEFATSDAHEGLVEALETTFPGVVWQRCQAHFMRGVLDATPEQLRQKMHEHLIRILRASTP